MRDAALTLALIALGVDVAIGAVVIFHYLVISPHRGRARRDREASELAWRSEAPTPVDVPPVRVEEKK